MSEEIVDENQVQVPEVWAFREAVDAIPKRRDSVLIKALYLTASRTIEMLTRVSPWSAQYENAQAYGRWMKWGLANFEHSVFSDKEPRVQMEKVLWLQTAVAKRVRKGSKRDPDRRVYKIVALPTTEIYEPWSVDLWRYLKETGRLSFDLTRYRVWQIVKENLHDLDPQIHPHLLRHYRLSHLQNEYSFSQSEITYCAGWSFGNVFGQGSLPSSPKMLEIYLHGQWRSYFPKLLRPLSSHLTHSEAPPREEEAGLVVKPDLLKVLRELSLQDAPLQVRLKRLKAEGLATDFVRLAKMDPGRASELLDFKTQTTRLEERLGPKIVEDMAREEEYR